VHWARRSGIAAAAVAAAFTTGPPLVATGAAAGAVVDEDGYRLLSLRLGRLTLVESLEAYELPSGGVCVDLRQLVDALDFAIAVDARAGTAEGWFRTEDRRFSLAAADAPAGSVLRAPQGLCVDTAVAGGWFGIDFAPDLPNAVLVASSAEKLPVELAMARKQRRGAFRPVEEPDLSRFPHADTPYAWWRTPAIDVVASAGYVDDAALGDKRATGRYELYASGEAARLSFDARFASNEDAEPESLRLRAYRKDPDGALLGPLKATEVALGDVASYGSVLTSENSFGRGAYVTNQPLDRPQTFDRTDFRGELPAGWDAELYRNGQLIAFADSRDDGRYEFLGVPLLFGINRFEIVLYGQQGQIRREKRTINVGGDSIPAGKTHYWVGALQHQKDLLTLKNVPRASERRELRASAVIEHGIDGKTSASLQAHTLVPETDDDARVTYVEGAVRRVLGPAIIELNLAADFDGGVAYGGQFIAEFGSTTVTGQTLWARDFVSDRIEPGLDGQHTLAIDHFFDLGASTLPVGARVTYKDWQRPRADTVEVATRISARLAGLSLTHEVAWQHASGVRGAGGDDQLTTSLLAGGRIGDTRLRGEARYRLQPGSVLESVTLVAERPIGERGELRGEIAWDGPLDRARFGAGYSRQFDRLALGARAEAATDGSFAAGINLALSFGPDARGRYARVTSHKLASAGQAAARVFTDSNRNGVWDGNEPVHEGVTIAAGTARADAPTDANGTTMVDGLRSFQPQLLSVDTSTLADPLLKPAVRGIVVTPRPGIAQAVDFALLPTGEVEGMLYIAASGEPQPRPGADLELVNAAGDVVAEARSDFDGFFLFQDVVYGQYRLQLSAATARALDAGNEPLATVSVGDPDPVVRTGALIIRRTPQLTLDLSALADDGSVSF
jgi:hypothetical protein